MFAAHRRFAIAAAIYAVGLTILIAVILYWNDGNFIYVLDDAYIHLTVARNLFLNGTWGIVPNVHASASSSPAWVLLLTAFGGTKVLEFVPLAFNIVLSFLVLFELEKVLRIANDWIGFWLCVASPVLLHLLGLTLTGMEHLLHIWLMLVLWAGVWRRHISLAKLALLTALLPMVRYESLFVIFTLALVLIYQRQFVRAAVSVSAATASVAAYGFYNLSCGDLFLPNSVLVKALADKGITSLLAFAQSLLFKMMKGLWRDKFLLVLLGLFLIFIVQQIRRRKFDADFLEVSALLVCVVIHAAFASFGWFQRYQMYLVVLAVSVFFQAGVYDFYLSLFSERRRLAEIGLAAILFVSAESKIELTILSPLASNDIYSIPCQTARLIRLMGSDMIVAAGDVGAVSFKTSNVIYDMEGLGTTEIAKARLAGKADVDFYETFARDKKIDVAVFNHEVPPHHVSETWGQIARIQLPNPSIVLAADNVSFYAITPAGAERLMKALMPFQQELPREVSLTIEPPKPER
jgi:hypothetical protein